MNDYTISDCINIIYKLIGELASNEAISEDEYLIIDQSFNTILDILEKKIK